jgi:E3 ubiquitin-protein ligase DOA10
MAKRATYRECRGKEDHPLFVPGKCMGHYDSFEECHVEIVGDFGYYKCKAPAVHEGVCEYHHELGRTKELFMQNLEKMIRIS